MADKIEARVDFTAVQAGFDLLNTEMKESLARRMGAAGARVLRDEAKARAPVSDGEYNPASRGSQQPGTLRNSIYMAYNERLSSSTTHTYSVSWNAKKAWWGKLVEFGYYRRFAWGKDAAGNWTTFKSMPLANPVRVPAKPFLGSAFDSHMLIARDAMIAAGKVALAELLAKVAK